MYRTKISTYLRYDTKVAKEYEIHRKDNINSGSKVGGRFIDLMLECVNFFLLLYPTAKVRTLCDYLADEHQMLIARMLQSPKTKNTETTVDMI